MPGPTSIASGEPMGSSLSHAGAPFAGAAAGAVAMGAGAMAVGAIGARPAAGAGVGGGGSAAGAGASGALGASGSVAIAGCAGSFGSRSRFSRAWSRRPGRICWRSISLLGAGFWGAGAVAGGVCSRWIARTVTVTMQARYHCAVGVGCAGRGLAVAAACSAPSTP